MVPYTQGLGERFKRTCNNKGIQVHFKGTNTIKTHLMAPKSKDNKLPKSGVIYKFKCPHINCPEEYIGESGRTFGDRLKEHLRVPPPIHHHSSSTGHLVSPECFTIVEQGTTGSYTETSRRLCTFMYMTIHLIGTWVNINFHIFGTRSCKTH